MLNEEEDAASRKRRLARERQSRWMKKQSQESLAKIRKAQVASHRNRIERMTSEQAIENRAAIARKRRQRIEQMTPEQAKNNRLSHAGCQLIHMKKKHNK